MENLEEPEKRSCAVCARILNPIVTPGGEVHWEHAEMDWADHPAVPVEPGEVHTRQRCDFCSSDDPEWVIPTRTFDSGSFPMPTGLVDTASGENFAACEACRNLVETNQWNGLVRRVAKAMGDKHGFDPQDEAGQAVLAGLKDFYRKLRKNITGAARPLKEETR